ncbi:MAG: HEAT repeat domain-containing protein [Deltaproteobacteria bacterium]|nr:HEAT repeat domain-containing protein [Deltaproteobacteria bacterium]
MNILFFLFMASFSFPNGLPESSSLIPATIGNKSSSWFDTKFRKIKLSSIKRLLESESSTDNIEGMKISSQVEWKLVREEIILLINSLDSRVSKLALSLTIKHHEPIASAYMRQMIAFEFMPKKRAALIKRLAELKNPDDSNFFMRLLKFENIEIRTTVIEILGELKIRNAINPLIKLINDSREQVRIEIIKALVSIGGKQIIIPVVSRLTDSSKNVRKAAIKGLSALPSELTREPLLKILRTGSASEKLGVLQILPGNPEINKHLEKVLISGSVDERKTAIRLLTGEISDPLFVTLYVLAKTYTYDKVLKETAGKKFYTSNTSLLKKLFNKRNINYYQKNFLGSLAASDSLNGAGVSVLRDVYTKKILYYSQIIEILRNSVSSSAIQFQLELFSLADIKEKIKIVNNFMDRRDDTIVPLLLKSIKKNPSLKRVAINFAEQMPSRLFTDFLKDLVKNPSYSDYATVLKILRITGDSKTHDTVLSLAHRIRENTVHYWGNYFLFHMTPRLIKKILLIRTENVELKKEIKFLKLYAYTKGYLKPEADKEISDIYDIAKLALLKRTDMLNAIPEKFKNSFFDLLPLKFKGNSAFLKYASNNKSFSTSRFIPDAISNSFSTQNICTRINISSSSKNTQKILKLLKKETDSRVIYNFLINLKSSEISPKFLLNFYSHSSGISDEHWSCLLDRLPLKQRKNLKIQLGLKNLKRCPVNHNAKSLTRFILPYIPSDLACITVAVPGAPYRSVSPGPTKTLLLFSQHTDTVSIEPVFK